MRLSDYGDRLDGHTANALRESIGRGRFVSDPRPTGTYHLPNFVLAALMYTLLGRALLGLIVEPDSPNYIWRFFCRITDPVVAPSRW